MVALITNLRKGNTMSFLFETKTGMVCQWLIRLIIALALLLPMPYLCHTTISTDTFKADSDSYDYSRAIKAGLRPDNTGHWPSRVPETGLILKGNKHPTFHLTIQEELKQGYAIIKKDGRYYSVKS